VERPPPPLLVGPACQDTVFLPQNGSTQFSRPRRLQNRTVRDFCAVSRPPTPPLVTTSPWTAAGATPRPERRRRRRARSPHSLRSAEVSSSSLSSLYRSPPRRSYQPLAVLLRDAVCGARRTMVTCSRALLQVVTQRRQRAARACCCRRLPVLQARCPTCKPRAPSPCPCAQRPSSCALGVLRPVPIPRSPSPARARRTPSTPPWLAMATESPSPTPPVSLQPAPSVRPPSSCLGLTNSRVAHVKSHVRSALAAVIAQLVRALAFACAQCVDGTSSTPRRLPSTPVYPSSNPRVRSCRSPSPTHHALNRRVLFARVACAVRTCRRAFYAR
jgi:hypothetical protein